MSAAAREVTWAGGTHVFDLNSRRVAWMLNDGFPGQYGPTVAAVLRRFDEQVYSPADIENVFRIGMLGGGMLESDVEALIEAHVRGQPLAPLALIAFGLVTAVFIGAENVDTDA
ncbi:MAG TPA: GTA-gp10 family protein [Nitrobacter sp.]|jgi:hypothetical protein|nr:GTA-gp10 family protein [Nitrobacter sp.]